MPPLQVASTHELDCAQLEAGFGPHDDPPMSLSEAEAAARGSHAGSRASSPPPPERNGKAPMYQQHPHSGPSSAASGGSLPPLSEISSAPLLAPAMR